MPTKKLNLRRSFSKVTSAFFLPRAASFMGAVTHGQSEAFVAALKLLSVPLTVSLPDLYGVGSLWWINVVSNVLYLFSLFDDGLV